MEVIVWGLIIVIGKLAIYVGFAGAMAGVFQLLYQGKEISLSASIEAQRVTLNYMSVTCFLALLGTIVWFIAQTGAMAEEGIQGALDPMMIEIMWDSSVGKTAQFRLIAFFILTTVSVYLSTQSFDNNRAAVYISRIALTPSLFLLIYSFTLSGHSVELGFISQLLMAVHVAIFAWWFGALYLLWRKCNTYSYNYLYQEMERFGRQASIAVPLLLVVGGILAYQLIGSVSELFTSSYGRTLILKLLVVSCILGLAAYHKFKLVPALKQHQGREQLARSIVIEMGLAITVLLITSGLTSFVGPATLN